MGIWGRDEKQERHSQKTADESCCLGAEDVQYGTPNTIQVEPRLVCTGQLLPPKGMWHALRLYHKASLQTSG